MAQILIPANSPEQWKQFLAQPEKQWKSGYSARALAYSWHEAQGFPRTVRRVFSESRLDVFEDIEPLIMIPEYKVPLPGGRRPSQNDIWVLGRSMSGLVSITVEGKVSEAFGPGLGSWFQNPTSGKRRRLDFIVSELGLSADPPPDTRYQLLHRTASAVIEAKRFGAGHAMMLVHSFSQTDECFDDYALFVSLFGGTGAVDRITAVGRRGDLHLYFGWVRGEARYLAV